MNSTRQLINSSGNHTVQIHATADSQVDSITRYIKEGLLNGEGIFVISRPKLREILKSKMHGLSFDGQSFQDSDQIRFFDAQILLLYLQSGDGLEKETFQKNLVAPIKNAQSKYKKVRALGEMFDILWKQNQHDMLIQLICYFKKLTNTQGSSVLCIYSLDQLDSISYEESFDRIRKNHLHLAYKEDHGSLGQRDE